MEATKGDILQVEEVVWTRGQLGFGLVQHFDAFVRDFQDGTTSLAQRVPLLRYFTNGLTQDNVAFVQRRLHRSQIIQQISLFLVIANHAVIKVIVIHIHYMSQWEDANVTSSQVHS